MNTANSLNPPRSVALTLLLAVTILAVCCSRGPQINPTPSPPQPNRSDLLAGRVVRIADGDTVTLLDANNTEHRIRLQGIDAPESHQDFGAQSKKNLSDMIYNQEVTADCDKTDQYGRQVCKILLKDKDINLEQIKAGMAWHYKEYEREQSPQDREVYARAEDEAHRTRRGLWADPNPVEPGEFRREQRRERKAKR